MEVMRLADTPPRADGRAQGHVIARDQQAAATLAKPRDRLAIRRGQAVAGINREQPELVEVALVDRRQDRVRLPRRIAVTHGDVVKRIALLIPLLPEERAEPTETRDRPVVLGRRDRRLQQDFLQLDRHIFSSCSRLSAALYLCPGRGRQWPRASGPLRLSREV